VGPAILVACDDLVEAGAIELALEHGFASNIGVWTIEQVLRHEQTLNPRVVIVSCTQAQLTILRRATPPDCTLIVLQDDNGETKVQPEPGILPLERPIALDQLVATVGRCMGQDATVERSVFTAVEI
jgi:hypothetical protein